MAEDSKSVTPTNPVDDDVAKLINSGSAGVDTAIRALEAAELVYYGAVAATELPTVITTTAVSPHSPDPTL